MEEAGFILAILLLRLGMHLEEMLDKLSSNTKKLSKTSLNYITGPIKDMTKKILLLIKWSIHKETHNCGILQRCCPEVMRCYHSHSYQCHSMVSHIVAISWQIHCSAMPWLFMALGPLWQNRNPPSPSASCSSCLERAKRILATLFHSLGTSHFSPHTCGLGSVGKDPSMGTVCTVEIDWDAELRWGPALYGPEKMHVPLATALMC